MMDNYHAFVSKSISQEPLGEGVLQGKTFAVKDVFHIQGYTSSAGNPDWLRTHGPAGENAPVITQLLKQGARLQGTTHTDELMYSLNGENAHYGTPVNPKAPDRIPGGSSSGSAAAVSADLVDFALGTDTGGSVRIPASYCGVYGFRPTHGTISLDGVIPLAPGFDTVGWMAGDTKTLLEVGRSLIAGEDEEEPVFRRVLYAKDAWDLADESARKVLLKFVPSFNKHFEEIKWINIAPQGFDTWMNVFRIIQGLEIWEAHGDWIEKTKPQFGPGIAERFAWTRTLQKRESQAEFDMWNEIRRYLRGLLRNDTVLVIPTAPGAAPLLHLTNKQIEHTRTKTLQLTSIAGLGGLPQITLPRMTEGGRPLGLSMIAGKGQDRKLLKWVHQFLSLNISNSVRT